MYRTSVVLPSQLKNLLLDEAARRGVSLGEFIRQALTKYIANPDSNSATDTFLSSTTVFDDNVPTDISLRHDQYLYGKSAKSKPSIVGSQVPSYRTKVAGKRVRSYKKRS